MKEIYVYVGCVRACVRVSVINSNCNSSLKRELKVLHLFREERLLLASFRIPGHGKTGKWTDIWAAPLPCLHFPRATIPREDRPHPLPCSVPHASKFLSADLALPGPLSPPLDSFHSTGPHTIWQETLKISLESLQWLLTSAAIQVIGK